LDPEVTETVHSESRVGEAAAAMGASAVRTAIVGAGRSGGALAVALHRAGHPVVAVWSRSSGRAAALAERVDAAPLPTPLAAVRASQVAFLAVPDREIVPVAAAIAASGAALRGHGVAHLSASRHTDVLASLRVAGAVVGCFHPLQALAGEASAANLRGTLVAVDGDPPLRHVLDRLAGDLGGRPVTLSPAARGLYHAAAVLAGNAPLALLDAATELLQAAGIDRDTAERGLLALMRGALDNAARAGSREALTGPVARGDAATISLHLAALRDRPEGDALYRALTRATVRLAGARGREEILRLIDPPGAARNGHHREGAGARSQRNAGAAPARPVGTLR
jgi:predicted short-subunit dehydrogenase-like oxidoreductase (DUF2520 family)